jgi:exodeoxyribonuclease X
MTEVPLLSVLRFCDTETTGFPPHAEMVEIGWTDLRLYPEGWVIEVDNQSAFVNPGCPIPSKVSAIHGITDDMVVDGMHPNSARALLDKDTAFLGAHNVAFDRQFVRSGKPWICTLECGRKLWPQAENHKLETLKAFLGIELDGDAHRAGYDAAVAARIFLEAVKLMPFDEMINVSKPDHVPRVMPFGKHKGVLFSQIDLGYLEWILKNDGMSKGIKTAARLALQARESAPVAKASGSAWDRSF